MTDEEINRKFDVVADHLATLATGLQRLEEAHERGEKRIDRLERVVGLAVRAGLRERRSTREKLDALIDAHVKTGDAMRELSSIVARHVADGHGS